MLYLGIDQHARQTTISLRAENGDVLQARRRPPRRGRSARARTEDGLHYGNANSPSHPGPGPAGRATRPAPPACSGSAAGCTPSQACWSLDPPCRTLLVFETICSVSRRRRAGPLNGPRHRRDHAAPLGLCGMVREGALPFLERPAVY